MSVTFFSSSTISVIGILTAGMISEDGQLEMQIVMVPLPRQLK